MPRSRRNTLHRANAPPIHAVAPYTVTYQITPRVIPYSHRWSRVPFVFNKPLTAH